MKNNNKIGLTENEMNLIYDSMNGIVHDFKWLFWERNIISDIMEINKGFGMSKKWNVNFKVLIKKLEQLTEVEMLQLIIEVDRFWEKDDEIYIKLGKITPSQKMNEILNR